jgi:hypothetical protein
MLYACPFAFVFSPRRTTFSDTMDTPMQQNPFRPVLLALALSCLACLQAWAQAPVIYLEAGLHTRALNALYRGSLGLQMGRHDLALELGTGQAGEGGRHVGLRYRHSLHADAVQTRLDPFVVASFGYTVWPNSELVSGGDLRVGQIELGAGLRIGLAYGFSLRGQMAMAYRNVHVRTDQFITFTFRPALAPAAALGLAYNLPFEGAGSGSRAEAPVPAAALPTARFEVGLSVSNNSLVNFARYASGHVHFAYRVLPRWDVRGGMELPTWPLNHDRATVGSEPWMPGLRAGVRFWAYPGARVAFFADAGALLIRRYIPLLNGYIQSGPHLSPEMAAGVRLRLSPVWGVELAGSFRAWPIKGAPILAEDRGLSIGLSYRIGPRQAPRAAPRL